MSHFVVLVIGADHEKQLAPYHEFECTGLDNQYVQNIDLTIEAESLYNKRDESEAGESFINFVAGYYGYEDPVVFGEAPDLANKHKYGYIELAEDGTIARVIDRTNPNKQWDWYQIGGRWSGFLLRKDGKRVDVALKGEIDFDKMRNDAADEAAKRYDRRVAITPLSWESWTSVRERFAPDYDAARDFYHKQEALVLLRASKDDEFSWSLNDALSGDRDEYIKTARDGAVSTYAVVKDSQWQAKGEMGWWGISTDKMAVSEWNAKFAAILDKLPDDTLLTVVDCHI